MKEITFEDVWLDLKEILKSQNVIYTLSKKKLNEVTSVSEDGVEVRTQRSAPDSELVPKSMFREAIDYLISYGDLRYSVLTNELRIMRSSFVMAALAHLPYISYEIKPLKIFLRDPEGYNQ